MPKLDSLLPAITGGYCACQVDELENWLNIIIIRTCLTAAKPQISCFAPPVYAMNASVAESTQISLRPREEIVELSKQKHFNLLYFSSSGQLLDIVSIVGILRGNLSLLSPRRI